MIRAATLLLLVIALVPVPLTARQAVSGERVHTVRPGETLGSIARDYLGSAGAWNRIFEANQDRLANPDRLGVGMELRIPGVAGPGTPAPSGATVLGVGVQLPAATVGEDLGWEARSALLAATPFTPGAAPEPGREDRTVFYQVATRTPDAPAILLQRQAELPALPPGVFEAAGWLRSEGEPDEAAGVIVGFAEPQDARFGRRTVHPHDEVRLRSEGDVGLVAGEELMAYRVTRVIPGVGEVLAPTGRLVVTRLVEDGAIARVVNEVGRMQLGDAIGTPRTFPLSPGVHPSEANDRVEARIVAFQDRKELYLPGDFGFVDIGLDGGLAVGDELVARGEGAGGGELARFQVVGVRDHTATVRLLSVLVPGAVRPGLPTIRDRSMP